MQEIIQGERKTVWRIEGIYWRTKGIFAPRVFGTFDTEEEANAALGAVKAQYASSYRLLSVVERKEE